MPTPAAKTLFPRLMDGVAMTIPALIKASGLTRYDICRAVRADPSIHTMDALRAAVRAYKSRPSRLVHRPARSSMLWNGATLERPIGNKTSTKSPKSHDE